MMWHYLVCINLNGMVDAEQLEADPKKKILPIGQGVYDEKLIRIIAGSGWEGPIGILDHRNEVDAAQSLRQNLDGLAKIVKPIEAE